MRLSLLRLAMSKLYMPPSNVRGMKILDRTAFSTRFTVPCVRVHRIDGPRHHKLINRLTPYFLKFSSFKAVVDGKKEENDVQQMILLDEEILSENGTDLKDLTADFNDYCQIGDHPVQLTYENWSPQIILRAILPGGDEACSSYSQIGHIVQVNLREEVLDHKQLIGQIFLDKVRDCRTVVNKLDKIDDQFRTLSFELLAGEPDYVCQVNEHGFKYEFDFRKVFWNSRLSTEHKRLVSLFKAQQVIYDVCAGVGPFAVPAAKRKLAVLANDLNPDCVEYLRRNATLNKVNMQAIHCMDGVRFITEIAGPDLVRRTIETRSEQEDAPITTAAHFVMNLPAMAVDFLPSFAGLLRGVRQTAVEVEKGEESASKRVKLHGDEDLPRVFIHCYTFVKGDESYKKQDFEAKAVEKVKGFLSGWEIHDVHVHDVRNVAPNKEMLCVSFRADEKMLLAD